MEPKNEANISVYNPYPSLGAPAWPCWPRGFPLDVVQMPSPGIEPAPNGSKAKFGVLQSLADVEPDVDAIYRLTHGTPFVFDKGKKR